MPKGNVKTERGDSTVEVLEKEVEVLEKEQKAQIGDNACGKKKPPFCPLLDTSRAWAM